MRCGGYTLFRLSAVRNAPVICRNERIGLLQGMSVNLQTKQITDLIVGCGLRGKRRILCRDVRSIADGFILLKDDAVHMAVQDCKENLFVLDTSGLLIGHVVDYMIDESVMTVQALEIVTGYWPCRYTKRIWLFEYEYRGEEIIVPASFGGELIKLREEDEICV